MMTPSPCLSPKGERSLIEWTSSSSPPSSGERLGEGARFAIDRASRADAMALAPHLRAADVEEIRAASGLAPAEALRRSYELSSHVWAVRELDGPPTAPPIAPPIALWGVGPLSLVEGRGCPWLLATDAFEGLGPDIARLSRPLMAAMRELYPRLENRVDARHTRAVRWLAWLGFTIDPAQAWGVEGRPFHRFWI